MKFYQLEESDIRKLRAVAKRLYTEDRMNGDEMRDAAQIIDGVIRNGESYAYDDGEYELRAIQSEDEPKMMYGVFENGKPASEEGYPNLKGMGWDTHLFPTFVEACAYARMWLGEYNGVVGDFYPDTVYGYSGYGDNIEIRTLKEKQ